MRANFSTLANTTVGQEVTFPILKLKVNKISASAQAKIEAAGGSVEKI